MPSLEASIGKMVLHDSVDDTISRLESLPEEIRQEILRYVLHTKYACLLRPGRTSVANTIGQFRAFDWNIGVLRTCRTLHNDGSEILNRENKWIKLVIYLHPITLAMSLPNDDVHCIK
jgi:hypothetical protein